MDHKDIWLVLGLTVVLAIAVSISTASITGDAIFSRLGSKATTVQKAPTKINLPTLPTTSTCKIISVLSNDYQWIYKSGLTAASVCAKENLVCNGVEHEITTTFLDTNGKAQAVDINSYWLTSHYCKDTKMGISNGHMGTPNSIDDYSEPYAGDINIMERYISVLCCAA